MRGEIEGEEEVYDICDFSNENKKLSRIYYKQALGYKTCSSYVPRKNTD
jgi:hypothetical protein